MPFSAVSLERKNEQLKQSTGAGSLPLLGGKLPGGMEDRHEKERKPRPIVYLRNDDRRERTY